MDQISKKILRRVVTDLVLLLAVGLPVLIFFVAGNPRRRGFFCNDESLKYPYHDSTVSTNALYIVGSGLPVVVIVICEYLISRAAGGQSTLVFMGHTIPPWFVNVYKFVGVFAFGAACSQLTTDIAKYLVGRLRPHFFEVCNPDINCTLPENQQIYFEHYKCQNIGIRPHRQIKDVGLSFPSGHSSFSAYTMLYLACYVQCRVRWKESKLLRHALQFLFLMMSWGTAMSRISDYKHHWSDVLCGLIIGCTTAALTVLYVSDLLPGYKQQYGSHRPAANCVDTPDYADGNDIHGPIVHENSTSLDKSVVPRNVDERTQATPLLLSSTSKYGAQLVT